MEAYYAVAPAAPDTSRATRVLRVVQTLTAISIFKYVNIVCIIQVHTDLIMGLSESMLVGPAIDP